MNLQELRRIVMEQNKCIEWLLAEVKELKAANNPMEEAQVTSEREEQTPAVELTPETVLAASPESIVKPTPAPIPVPAVATSPPAYVAETKQPRINRENWVGINLLSRLGWLLIVIGAISVAAFDGFHPLFRTGILFVLGFIVLALGEVMSRRGRTVVSLGVSAGGVALCFVAIGTSYFALSTLDMYAALAACVVATGLGVYLAVRHNAQVIGCFAIIGGFLPIFALDNQGEPFVLGLIVYFLLLALLTLFLSLSRKWTVMHFIGFGLTMISVGYLGWIASPPLALGYAVFALILYYAMPLLASVGSNTPLKITDGVLLALNGLIGTLWIVSIGERFHDSRLFEQLTLLDFLPLLWTIQGAFFAGIGIFHGGKILERTGLVLLLPATFTLMFYPLFFTFSSISVTLIVTIILGTFTAAMVFICGLYISKKRQWRGLGKAQKLVAAITLLAFSIYLLDRLLIEWIDPRMSRIFEDNFILIGLMLASLSICIALTRMRQIADKATTILANVIHGIVMVLLWSFAVDVGRDSTGSLILSFAWALIAFGLLLWHYMTKKQSTWTIWYKNIVFANVWAFSIYTVWQLLNGFFAKTPILIVLIFVIGLIVTRTRPFLDKGAKGIAIGANGIALLWLLFFGGSAFVPQLPLVVIHGVLTLAALLVIWDMFVIATGKTDLAGGRCMALSGYLLISTTQLLLVQANVAITSAWISILYALLGAGWIVAGFGKDSRLARRTGLFLSMAAACKLLVVDTWGLSTEMRIISYISLGIILIGVSFVYQKLSARRAG